ncbi:MAG: hypothetical protein GXO48_07835 [Chlorobi bacterium]|nr:hypothetical protein [Chlorobiota bacterium]
MEMGFFLWWVWWYAIDPSTEGYDIELEFKRKGILKIYKNGKLHERYAFRFEKHQSIYTGQEKYMLVLYPSRLTPKSWYVQGYQSVCFNGTNTLILHDECYECFSHHYVRIE